MVGRGLESGGRREGRERSRDSREHDEMDEAQREQLERDIERLIEEQIRAAEERQRKSEASEESSERSESGTQKEDRRTADRPASDASESSRDASDKTSESKEESEDREHNQDEIERLADKILAEVLEEEREIDRIVREKIDELEKQQERSEESETDAEMKSEKRGSERESTDPSKEIRSPKEELDEAESEQLEKDLTKIIKEQARAAEERQRESEATERGSERGEKESRKEEGDEDNATSSGSRSRSDGGDRASESGSESEDREREQSEVDRIADKILAEVLEEEREIDRIVREKIDELEKARKVREESETDSEIESKSEVEKELTSHSKETQSPDETKREREDFKETMDKIPEARRQLEDEYEDGIGKELERAKGQETYEESEESQDSKKQETSETEERRLTPREEKERARRAEERTEGRLAHDQFDDFDEAILEAFDKFGIDKDEVRERWRETIKEEIEKELEKHPSYLREKKDEADRELERTLEERRRTKQEAKEKAESSEQEGEYKTVHLGDGTVAQVRAETKTKTVEDTKAKTVEKEKAETKTSRRETEPDRERPQAEKESGSTKEIPRRHRRLRAREQEAETKRLEEEERKRAKSLDEKESESTKEIPRRHRRLRAREQEAETKRLEEEERKKTKTKEPSPTIESSSEGAERERSSAEREKRGETDEVEKETSPDDPLREISEILSEAARKRGRRRRPLPNEEGIGEFRDPMETPEERAERELMRGLDEDAKRRLKELLDYRIRSKEELDDLIEKRPDLKKAIEENPEAYEYATRYFRFKEKQRELGIPEDFGAVNLDEVAEQTGVTRNEVSFWLNDRIRPEFVRMAESLERELRRRLTWNFRSFLDELDDLYEREGTLVSRVPSETELVSIQEKLRESAQDEESESERSAAEAWVAIMRAVRDGKIESVVSDGRMWFKEEDVERVARELSLDVDTVVEWLRREKIPVLVESLMSAEWAEQSETEVESRIIAETEGLHSLEEKTLLQGIFLATKDSFDLAKVGDSANEANRIHMKSVERQVYPSTVAEYEVLLTRHPSVQEFRTFEKDDFESRAYYKIKEMLKSGGLSDLSARARWRFLSKKFSVKEGTIKAWFTQDKYPKMIRWLGRLEKKRLNRESGSATINFERRLYFPVSLSEYDKLLKRHPHVTEHPSFEKRDRYARIYFEIRTIRELDPTTPVTPLSILSKTYGLHQATLSHWFFGEGVPDILQQLASNERLRIIHEDGIPLEARQHRIDPSAVYDLFVSLRDCDNPMSFALAEILSKVCNEMLEGRSVAFIEMRSYNRKLGPRWLLDIGRSIKDNLEEVEGILNKQMFDSSAKYQLGYVKDTLYIWKHNKDPYAYLTLFGGECFYFTESDGKSLVHEARNHLNLQGNYIFSQLLRQITDINNTGRESIGEVTADLRHDRDHLFGETLQFILDITGKPLTDISSKILAVGQQGQIKNPRILEGTKLLELMARFYAIVASDGHVGLSLNFLGYHEYNPQRLQIVLDLFQKLGDVTFSYMYDDDRIAGIRFPHVLGRLMIRLGIPSGDKSIQEYGLPDFILNGPPEIICAYLEEVIPEDGYFSYSEKFQVIGISRHSVLFDFGKGEEYGFEQMLSRNHIELIKEYGKRSNGRVEAIHLQIGALRKLTKSEDSRLSSLASQLLRIALGKPNVLLLDEHRIISRVGMHCPTPSLEKISWFWKTQRVSSSWKMTMGDQVSIAKWGLLALPHDLRKREKLVKWMKSKPHKVEQARRQLESSGLLP